MRATVGPRQPPVAAFQQVYELTTSVMAVLRTQLPTDVYQKVQGLNGNIYLDAASFEADLAPVGIAPADQAVIEKAASAMGMTVMQTLEFTLTILNGASQPPEIVFDVARTDVLQDLSLGASGGAQTLQYAFQRVLSRATFVSSTVPGFNGAGFGDLIWPIAGEGRYDDTLQKLGQTGVPLPIMKGFQFVFDEAVLSIQQGYVSILAKVAFKG